MHIRVSLSEETFRGLVRGEVVKVAEFTVDGLPTKHELLVSLQDIGWDRIMKAVDDAYDSQTRR